MISEKNYNSYLKEACNVKTNHYDNQEKQIRETNNFCLMR